MADGGHVEADDTREAILDATYRVLCDRGYADLSMRAIAEESGKSKSLLHYHFDTKDDLLLAFLDRFVETLDELLAESESEHPRDRLIGFVDRFVAGPNETDRQSLWLALVEFRVRAAHDERFREQLARTDRAKVGAIARIIEDGVDEGAFREVDPEETAELIASALDGARTRQATIEADSAPEDVRDAIVAIVDDHLVEST